MAPELTMPTEAHPDAALMSPPDPFALSETQLKKWKERIAKAEAEQKEWHPWWDAARQDYGPRVSDQPTNYQVNINTNRSFTIVERKEADLFQKQPEVTVLPSPLFESVPGNEAMTTAHATIINEKLGLDGVNIREVFKQRIFDYELFGAGWAKIFYRAYTRDVQQPVQGPPDPLTGQPTPVIDPMTGQPQMETVPVIIHAECGFEPASPKMMIIPPGLKTTQFDKKAPFLGMKFEMSLTSARRIWKDKIPEDFTGSGRANDPSMKMENGQTAQSSYEDLVTGQEIYYRSCLERDDIVHPDHLTKIVFIDGITEPVEHRDDPDQTMTPDGQLTPDSRIGYPYSALIIRTDTDSAYVMSDLAVSLPITQEMKKIREMMIRQRKINLVRGYYNKSVMPEEALDEATSTEQGGLVGLPAEAFAGGGPISWSESAPLPNDTFVEDRILDHDLAQTFAVDATAAGTDATGSQTATEANLRQANVNVRLGNEQSFVSDCYIRDVTKFSTLVQRYLTVEDAAKYVGPQQAQAWIAWVKQIPTRLAFTMTPDSSLRNDTPLHRKQLQDFLTYAANDPTINRAYLWKKLAYLFHLDPNKLLIPQEQMPEQKPEPPKLSLNGDDLSPLNPQSPIILDLLAKSGYPVDPKAIEAAQTLGQMVVSAEAMAKVNEQAAKQPPHGGKLAPIDSLDKHANDITGAMQGSGQMSPQMSTTTTQGVQ